jgi:hypothetical protein
VAVFGNSCLFRLSDCLQSGLLFGSLCGNLGLAGDPLCVFLLSPLTFLLVVNRLPCDPQRLFDRLQSVLQLLGGGVDLAAVFQRLGLQFLPAGLNLSAKVSALRDNLPSLVVPFLGVKRDPGRLCPQVGQVLLGHVVDDWSRASSNNLHFHRFHKSP